MRIGSLSLTNSSVFTVKTMGRDVYVHLIGSGTPLLSMSREEALELSCRLEQAAQKIEESEYNCKGGGCMNLTNEQIEQILEGAPDGEWFVGLDGYVNSSAIAHNLSDLREILELRQRVRELEAQVPKWISVEDELPPIGQECLFFRPLAENSGDEPIAVKVARVDHGQCWESTVPHGFKPCNPSDGYCHVTHWMPIPQPPKGERQ